MNGGSNLLACFDYDYTYDPYGNALAATGTYAAANPFRFSTKWFDTETGLGYWGRRYLVFRLGRWANRDPVEENGGLNLYAAVGNSPVSCVDALGTRPFGEIYIFGEPTLGGKISRLILARVLRLMFNHPINWAFGEDYDLHDSHGEMTPVLGSQMNRFYEYFLAQHDSVIASRGWVHLNIPFQSAQDAVGQWDVYGKEKQIADTFWWLGGATDVRVFGRIDVCKESDEEGQGAMYVTKNLVASWQWHDWIDAKSIIEFKGSKSWSEFLSGLGTETENLPVLFIEGIWWDYALDKCMDVEPYVIIHWDDKVPWLSAFPRPGAVRP